jgi:PLP dependent protein
MIKDNIKAILEELPEGVLLVGAAKTRTHQEIREAIDAGLQIIGENYVQEAEEAYRAIGSKARWHMIGHLQTNKAKKAIGIFDVIETVDSLKLAGAIDRACDYVDKLMDVFIEINSGEEPQKAGVMPADALSLIREMAILKNIRIAGLMTMGPFTGDPEKARPFFRRTRNVFEEIRNADIQGVEMKFLSMGMSNSYKIALEEGANIVRIGTRIFGERN